MARTRVGEILIGDPGATEPVTWSVETYTPTIPGRGTFQPSRNKRNGGTSKRTLHVIYGREKQTDSNEQNEKDEINMYAFVSDVL